MCLVFGSVADFVVQMMNPALPSVAFMATNRSLGRVYMIGGVNPNKDSDPATKGPMDITRAPTPGMQVTMLASGR